MAFPAILKSISAENHSFFPPFLYILGSLGAYLTLWLPPPPSPARHSPCPIVCAPSSFWAVLTVSSSFYVKALRLRVWPRHDIKPPSLLLVTLEVIFFTTSSRTATSIYILAAWFKVIDLRNWPSFVIDPEKYWLCRCVVHHFPNFDLAATTASQIGHHVSSSASDCKTISGVNK